MILGCSFSGNFCSRPRRRKLMSPPRGATNPRIKVASPNLACTDFQCCLPCTTCNQHIYILSHSLGSWQVDPACPKLQRIDAKHES